MGEVQLGHDVEAIHCREVVLDEPAKRSREVSVNPLAYLLAKACRCPNALQPILEPLREIGEELAIEIEVGSRVAAHAFTVREKSYCLHVYWASITEGTPRADEHHALSWVTLDQLLTYDLAPADIPIAEEAIRSDRRNRGDR